MFPHSPFSQLPKAGTEVGKLRLRGAGWAPRYRAPARKPELTLEHHPDFRSGPVVAQPPDPPSIADHWPPPPWCRELPAAGASVSHWQRENRPGPQLYQQLINHKVSIGNIPMSFLKHTPPHLRNPPGCAQFPPHPPGAGGGGDLQTRGDKHGKSPSPSRTVSE